MKKLLISLICLTMTILNLQTPVKAEEELSFNGESIVIMDANSKRVLYSKNGDEKQYPASTTKVMTMLLGIEKGKLDQKMTMSEYAVMSIEYGSSHISLMPDEQITMKEAILAASIASANDACNGIAEAIAKTEDKFVEMMNQRAKEIGCTNTHFANAHGLHDEDHYTTAADIARIMSEACQNQTFLELTSILDTTIPPTNITPDTRYLYNEKEIMEKDSEYYIKEIKSAKSGYTDESRNCYVAYGQKNGVNIVVAVMNADGRSACYEDLQTAFAYAFKQYGVYKDVNDLFHAPKVPHGLFSVGGKTSLEKEFAMPAYDLKNENVKNFHIEYEIKEDATAKKKSDQVGSAKLYYQDTLVQSRTLLLKSEVQPVFKLLLSALLTLLKWLAILAVVTVVGLVIAKKIYTQYRRYMRRHKKR